MSSALAAEPRQTSCLVAGSNNLITSLPTSMLQQVTRSTVASAQFSSSKRLCHIIPTQVGRPFLHFPFDVEKVATSFDL
jgi:hypothetical protein